MQEPAPEAAIGLVTIEFLAHLRCRTAGRQPQRQHAQPSLLLPYEAQSNWPKRAVGIEAAVLYMLVPMVPIGQQEASGKSTSLKYSNQPLPLGHHNIHQTLVYSRGTYRTAADTAQQQCSKPGCSRALC